MFMPISNYQLGISAILNPQNLDPRLQYQLQNTRN